MSKTAAQSAAAQTLAAPGEWIDLILDSADPTEVWNSILSKLCDLALTSRSPAALHRETTTPDRLLAETAWDLWQEFPRCAPKVIDELKGFWVTTTGVGKAVLVLDGLSLRELPMIVQAGQARGCSSGTSDPTNL